MANEYEAEQKQLISEVEENEKVLIELQKQTVDMKMLSCGTYGIYRDETSYSNRCKQTY